LALPAGGLTMRSPKPAAAQTKWVATLGRPIPIRTLILDRIYRASTPAGKPTTFASRARASAFSSP
jgi:hypothetical protein